MPRCLLLLTWLAGAQGGLFGLEAAPSAAAQEVNRGEVPRKAPLRRRPPPVRLVDEPVFPAVDPFGPGQPQADDFPRRIKQFKKQHAARLRQLRLSELYFIRRTCQPTREEFERIAQDSRDAIDRATVMLATNQFMRSRSSTDARHLIGQLLQRSVAARLSSEQAERYAKELSSRDAARRRTATLALVAKLDRYLLLSAEQRLELEKVLAANWSETWSGAQMLLHGDQYFPTLPANQVLPILNEAQRGAWHGIYKRSDVYFGADLSLLDGVEIQDESLSGADSVSARADDQKR